MPSPLGPITLEADETHLVSLTIAADHGVSCSTPPSHPVLLRALSQLNEYFAGKRKDFDLPLKTSGTPFREAIWHALQEIPFGHSINYQKLGEEAGVGTAPRAVGGAVGANPLPIVIPCHRVLAADGTLTGYSGGGGISTKKVLLDLEGISYRSSQDQSGPHSESLGQTSSQRSDPTG